MKKGQEPAFPMVFKGPEGMEYNPGLTRRQYYAGRALQGILSNPNKRHMQVMFECGSPEGLAFGYADKMIKFEEKEEK